MTRKGTASRPAFLGSLQRAVAQAEEAGAARCNDTENLTDLAMIKMHGGKFNTTGVVAFVQPNGSGRQPYRIGIFPCCTNDVENADILMETSSAISKGLAADENTFKQSLLTVAVWNDVEAIDVAVGDVVRLKGLKGGKPFNDQPQASINSGSNAIELVIKLQ